MTKVTEFYIKTSSFIGHWHNWIVWKSSHLEPATRAFGNIFCARCWGKAKLFFHIQRKRFLPNAQVKSFRQIELNRWEFGEEIGKGPWHDSNCISYHDHGGKSSAIKRHLLALCGFCGPITNMARCDVAQFPPPSRQLANVHCKSCPHDDERFENSTHSLAPHVPEHICRYWGHVPRAILPMASSSCEGIVLSNNDDNFVHFGPHDLLPQHNEIQVRLCDCHTKYWNFYEGVWNAGENVLKNFLNFLQKLS